MDFTNKILFTQTSGVMIFRQSTQHSHPQIPPTNLRMPVQQPSYSTITIEVLSIREEAELINMLTWRKNTTMPIQRVRSFSFIQPSGNIMLRSFPKKIIVEVENIIPSRYLKNLNFKQAIYLILQLIIGKHALAYKFGAQGSAAFQDYGLNHQGQCRIIFPLLFRSSGSTLQKISTTPEIISQAFSLAQSISRSDIIVELRKFSQHLLSKQNLTNSSAAFFIQEMCHQQGITLPANIFSTLKGLTIKQQQPSVFQSFTFKSSHNNFEVARFMAPKSVKGPLSSIEMPTQNRQLAKSFCLTQRQQFHSRVQQRTMNRSVNEKRMNSSNCVYGKKKANKLDLAFSMCILPANSNKLPQEEKEIEIKKLSANQKKRANKYNTSNVTTCISSEASQLFDSERSYPKLERIHREIVERRKSNDSQGEEAYQRKIDMNEHIWNRKNFENIVSIVLQDHQSGENLEETQINKLEKLMSLLSKQKNKIDELNQSYSVCDSPDKKKLHSRVVLSNEVEEQIKQISQYVIKEESESSQINSSGSPFHGWSMNMNLLKQGCDELKESVYCGNQSQIIQHSYLQGLKLSKLGSMGRAIERSQIPESN